jgi:hypothetical protein
MATADTEVTSLEDIVRIIQESGNDGVVSCNLFVVAAIAEFVTVAQGAAAAERAERMDVARCIATQQHIYWANRVARDVYLSDTFRRHPDHPFTSHLDTMTPDRFVRYMKEGVLPPNLAKAVAKWLAHKVEHDNTFAGYFTKFVAAVGIPALGTIKTPKHAIASLLDSMEALPGDVPPSAGTAALVRTPSVVVTSNTQHDTRIEAHMGMEARMEAHIAPVAPLVSNADSATLRQLQQMVVAMFVAAKEMVHARAAAQDVTDVDYLVDTFYEAGSRLLSKYLNSVPEASGDHRPRHVARILQELRRRPLPEWLPYTIRECQVYCGENIPSYTAVERAMGTMSLREVLDAFDPENAIYEEEEGEERGGDGFVDLTEPDCIDTSSDSDHVMTGGSPHTGAPAATVTATVAPVNVKAELLQRLRVTLAASLLTRDKKDDRLRAGLVIKSETRGNVDWLSCARDELQQFHQANLTLYADVPARLRDYLKGDIKRIRVLVEGWIQEQLKNPAIAALTAGITSDNIGSMLGNLPERRGEEEGGEEVLNEAAFAAAEAFPMLTRSSTASILNDLRGYVYIYTAYPFSSVVKIGKSVREPEVRIREQTTGSPFYMNLRARIACQDCASLESCLQDLLTLRNTRRLLPHLPGLPACFIPGGKEWFLMREEELASLVAFVQVMSPAKSLTLLADDVGTVFTALRQAACEEAAKEASTSGLTTPTPTRATVPPTQLQPQVPRTPSASRQVSSASQPRMGSPLPSPHHPDASGSKRQRHEGYGEEKDDEGMP